ncbi:hypothetical protein [uncultured Bacteroides sp.]|uniref:hypothetical protein n=1 Tax=uncultured Bacteroides sp. TaxID=162156 RepID=UPI0025E80F07|nr:hypothetical protein [uncultured Bacteroides sp.]
MKAMKCKFYSLALVAGMSVLTACSNDNNNGDNNDNGNGNEIENGTTLKGTITSDVTLAAGNTYKLSGEYIVEDGATLNIEAGVKIISIYDDIVDYILVKQGGKINAVGTASAPIVMTSEKEEPGAWGGIHICGKAHTNAEGGKGSSEIGGATYGGNDEADNSGTLKYVRVEYSGYAFDSEHEANGITFYGVGNGTTVEYCQAYKGSDDGFEFFGGSVNVSNLVSVSCSDDSFDWTEGWNGTATNLVAYQEAEATLGYDCDCLIEADNNENNYAATPIAHPVLKNLILVGNNSAAGNRGIRLRRGTQVEIDGAKVCGKKNAVTLESEETENALLAGTSKLANMTVDSELKSEKSIYTNDNFVAAGNTIDTNLKYTSFDNIKAECEWMAGNWVK